jgi:Planctomycete cytochrome C
MHRTACGVLLLGAFTITGCKDDTLVGPDGSPSTIVFPADNVSYQAQVQPLFNQTCALAGCHDAGAPQGRVRLTDYGEAVIATPGVVIPGNPDASELVLRIEGRSGARMPFGRNPLNQNQITGIRTWIAEGAKNN